MDVKDIKTIITKWEQTGEGYEAPIKDGERLSFLVGRYLGGNRSCKISADIQITTESTTFILDIGVESIIEFSNEKTPTPNDIYELYKEAKPKWRYEIIQRGKEEGHPNPMIIIGYGETPFPLVKDSIEKAIAQSLAQNN